MDDLPREQGAGKKSVLKDNLTAGSQGSVFPVECQGLFQVAGKGLLAVYELVSVECCQECLVVSIVWRADVDDLNLRVGGQVRNARVNALGLEIVVGGMRTIETGACEAFQAAAEGGGVEEWEIPPAVVVDARCEPGAHEAYYEFHSHGLSAVESVRCRHLAISLEDIRGM